ncbi:hypothetical protein Tco_0826382 [Tanacetum coccineum]
MEQAHRGWDKKRKDAKRNTIVQSSVSLDEHVAVQWENKVRTLLASRLYLKIICQILSLVMMQGISGWQSRLKKKAVNKGYDRFQKIMSQLNQVRQEPDNVDINLNYGVKVVASSHSFCLSLKILLCSKPIIMRSAAYSSIEFIRFWHKRKKEWEVKFERTLASFESGMESSELKNICLLLRPVEKEDKPLYSRFVKAGRPCILDSSLKDPDKDIPTVLISRTLPAFWDVERNSYWLVLVFLVRMNVKYPRIIWTMGTAVKKSAVVPADSSSNIPADYVSAGHVTVPADRDRICCLLFIDDAIRMSHNLMDQVVQDKVTRDADNKRKREDDQSRYSSQNKRHEVVRGYAVGSSDTKEYAETLPLCDKCKLHHHHGSCPCGEKGHIRKYCPELENKNGESVGKR